MARLSSIASLALVACSRPQPTPERAPAASTAAVAVAVADAATERDAAPVTDASPAAVEDAAPPGNVKPHVRAKKWVCTEQECERWSSFAYDHLPAVTTDGAIAAVVEERDGWGHVPDPGVRFVDTRDGASLEFHALAQGKRDLGTYEAFAKRKSELEGIVAKVNAALDAKRWVTLLPAGDPLTFMLQEGRWVKIDAEDINCVACTFESRWTASGVTVALVTSSPSFGDGVAPKSVKGVKITVDGKVVLEKKTNGGASGPLWPVKAGCSERKLVLLGVRRDPNVALLRETNGATSHACDGKREPQEVRALRW